MAAKKKKKAPVLVPRRLPRLLLAGGGLVVFLWIAFFDSHSLLRRLSWHAEEARLIEENDALRQEIADLEARLAEPISDQLIEQIAREQYGMRRPGETVYRVEK